MALRMRRSRQLAAMVLVAGVLGGCASLLGIDAYDPGASGAPDAAPGCALAGMSCGTAGRCLEEGGRARCVCDRGYAGDACEQCAAGFDRSGMVCAERCGSGTCPAHASCDAAARACLCAVGYALENGTCVWRGGPSDPGFTGSPPAWQYPDGGAFDAALDATLVSPGLLFAPTGFVVQTFDMPTVEESEPFALDLALRTACSSCAYAPEFEVGTGRAFTSSPSGPARTTTAPGIWRQRLCLGDAAYGRATTLALGGTLEPYGFFFDDAVYVPDPSCPRPGQVGNGDFEQPGGWVATAGAGVVPLVGSKGTRGAQLVGSGADCNLQTITGKLSVPSAMTRPALQLAALGAVGKSLGVLLNGVVVAAVAGAGSENTETVCLRPWTRGLSTTIGFASDCQPGSFIVDDVRVVDHPSCPLDALLVDGDFESTNRVSVWSTYSDSNGGRGNVRHDGFDAHAGLGYLKLVGDNLCIAAVVQDVQVPIAVGAAGPAVTFWAKGNTTGRIQVLDTPLGVTSAYAPYKVCLPPDRAGRRLQLSVGMRPQDGQVGCTGDVFVDDVALTTDAACPAR